MTLRENEQMNRLFEAILSLRSREECYRFFDDLCTVREAQAMAQRLSVARLLRKGLNYGEVQEMTGISPATICRVRRCLQYGAGYEEILQRMEEGENGND